jgi:hypothetical protein
MFASNGDKLVDIVVDDVRHLLYATSKLGKMSLFYLPQDGGNPVPIVQRIDLIERAKDSLSRRRPALNLRFFKDDNVVGSFVISVEESKDLHGKAFAPLYLAYAHANNKAASRPQPSSCLPREFAFTSPSRADRMHIYPKRKLLRQK